MWDNKIQKVKNKNEIKNARPTSNGDSHKMKIKFDDLSNI